MYKRQLPWKSKFRRRKRSIAILKTGSILGSLLVLMLGAHLISARGDVKTAVGALAGQCRIKGNISANGGKRIYHVPGQKYYLATRIDLIGGERWFCSESQARAAGWRRSRT